MTSPIIFAGGEDIDFFTVGSILQTSGNGCVIDTTSGRFRAGYARYGLGINGQQSAGTNEFYFTPNLGSLTTFWFSARFWCGFTSLASTNTANVRVWELRDGSGNVRLRMRNTSSGQGGFWANGPFVFEKLTALGVATQLGSATIGGFTIAPTGPDKLDVFVNYSASGSLAAYINGTPVYSFSGDLTTDGNTSVSTLFLGGVQSGSNTTQNVWSEVIVSTLDTRAMGLVTQAPVANGNTNTFTSNAASNVNGNQAQDTNPDYAASAGEIDEYEVTPGMPAGFYGIVSVVQKARMACGSTGPQNAELMVRTGGTDYVSGSIALTQSFQLYTNNWDTNPNTSASWQISDLAASSANFNIGVKSLT